MSQNFNNSQRANNTQRGSTVLGATAGTGFRSMAAAMARSKKRRGGNRDDSDDDYFENPNRISGENRKSNKKNVRGGANNRSRKGPQNRARSALSRDSSRHSRSASIASSLTGSYSSDSYYSDDSHPTRGSRQSRSVHSHSTYSRRSFATHSSANSASSVFSDDDYSSSSSYTGSAYSQSVRSFSRSHTGGTKSASATHVSTKEKDGRSTLRSHLSSHRSASVASRRRRDRSVTGSDIHSFGGGEGSSGSDSGGRRDRSRSRSTSPVRRARQQKLAIAAVLDSTAAGGFECLLEDPAKQPTTKRSHRHSGRNHLASQKGRRRHGSKSLDRGSSAAASDHHDDDHDDARSLHDRKEQAAEYRLNVPILQRFCTEFSAPFSFITADTDTYSQHHNNQEVITTDELTGVPLNTKNKMNVTLMASIKKAVDFVLVQAPQYPSEMVRALMWRVVQSSKGPHDRLGAWKLVDGVLRCLHRRMVAYKKNSQVLKTRESVIMQQRHDYEQSKVQRSEEADEGADNAETDAETDRQLLADIASALSLLAKERVEARAGIRWVKTMLTELAQLLPYLILYCWGGDKSAAFKTGASSSRAAAKRLAQHKKESSAAAAAASGTLNGGVEGTTQRSNSSVPTSNASESGKSLNDVISYVITSDLDAVKRKVLDFVAGRIHGDGSMTERGQHHHATLLRHHHSLENLAASTAAPRNTITTQSRFAVGNSMHLTTSMAKQVITEQEIRNINAQIYAEYELILRGWNALFASDQYIVSYVHLRRAVGDYAALLSDHDAAMGLRMGIAKSVSKHREGSDLYHFALKASHLHGKNTERSISQQFTDGIYYRQREVFEAFLLPPARMVDALWRFRRTEPRPSLVAAVLSQYGFPVFKTGLEDEVAADDETGNADAGASSSQQPNLYDPLHGAAMRRVASGSKNKKNRPEDAVYFCYPRSVAEVSNALGFEINDRMAAWVKKAADHCGGCLACDTWSHNFNNCPYRPCRFTALNRRIVATLSASDAIELLKPTLARGSADRNTVAATLATLAGGGLSSADRASSDAATSASPASGATMTPEQQGTARKSLILEVLDTAAERCAGGVEMDSILNALDVLLRQTSSGRERQALALLASYRLQPSKMLQFTNAASNSVAPVSRRSGRRKQNLVDFGRSGRTPAAEKLLAYLNQENRYYESGRLRAAMETLYFRFLCIPHSDAVMVQQLQRDIALIRENRCFVDVLADDEAPLQSRIFAVAPKSVLAAAIARVKRVSHLLDPCTLELSPCCAGAAIESVRAHNSEQGHREPIEATEPWDWYVARQVLKSERLVSQHDGLSTSVDDFSSRFQHASELVERLEDRANYLDGRDDGRVAASRLRLVAHIVNQCGFCTSCNRFGHSRRTCAELAATLIRNNLSIEARRELGISSITTARIAAPMMINYIRTLQASRHRARDDRKSEIDRDVRTLTELISLLGASNEGAAGGRNRGNPGNNASALRIPSAVALIARRVGGVRSGQIDLGSTATCPALPPTIGAAIKAITTQTGLSLAEVRFCPDECLALFHSTSYHHLTPHIAAFRSRQFPALVITTSQYEDDAFDERAALDRVAGVSMTADLSSHTLAQLSNPSAKRRHRAYALPAEQFTGIALGFDGTGRLPGGTVLSDGLLRALNAQQLCRDRYLDLASYLMRSTGSGSVDSDGVPDYETAYSLLFPIGTEARLVRQRLLARGQALHDELFRRVSSAIPTLNPNAPITQRPYNAVYDLERDYFLRNLTGDGDKASYTFYAAVQCRSNMSARIRRFTQERAVPLPKSSSVGGTSSSSSSVTHNSNPSSQQQQMPGSYSAPHGPQALLPPHMLGLLPSQPIASSYGTVVTAPPPPPLPPQMMGMPPLGVVVPPPLPPHLLMGAMGMAPVMGGAVGTPPLPPPPPGMMNAFRLSSGLLFSQAPQPPKQDLTATNATSDINIADDQPMPAGSEVYGSAVAEQYIKEADDIIRGMEMDAEESGAGAVGAEVVNNGGDEAIVGQKRIRSADDVEVTHDGEPQTSTPAKTE